MDEQTGFQLLVATFADESTAATAVNRLLGEFRGNRADMPAAAFVAKDEAGELTIRETADATAKQGAAAGAVVGGLIGLISRRRGALSSAALGALLGGVATHKLDTGIPDPRLEAIGQALDESTGAAVAIVSDGAYDRLAGLMQELGGQVESEPFTHDTDFMKHLQAGNLSGAAGALANQAEGALTGASAFVVEKTESLTGREGDSGAGDQPLILTEKELPDAP